MFEEENAEYEVSFFCYYENNLSKHYQKLKLSNIPIWISAYHFTHPDVKSIVVKIWLDKMMQIPTMQN